MGLRIALDLRPRGPQRWARALAEALVAAGPEHEWLNQEWKQADLVLALGGARPRFGPPAWTAVHDPRPGWSTAWTSRQSARLLAPSDTVAHALRTYFRVPAQKILRLPPLAPPAVRRARRPEIEGFQARQGLTSRWFVALSKLRPDLTDLPVIQAEALSVEELPVALSGAIAVVDPDPRSGNAIGLLEGMACGAPAVVAAGGAGAEVLGSAGILVDASDLEGWKAALALLAAGREERNRMAAGALRTARQFRAEDAARRLLAGLDEAARAGRPAAGAG